MPYVCSTCLNAQPLFHVSCPDCGAWNSLENRADRDSAAGSRPIALSDLGSAPVRRIRTNIGELDRLLGDGLVPSSSLLLTGTPGAGKSTLVLRLLKSIRLASLYVSGEESLQQLKIRADRLKINSPKVFLLFETDVGKILPHAGRLRPGVLVIDSIQTMYSELSTSAPGGPAQIRKCCYLLRRAAQQKEFILILVGQVTKGKVAAGPKLLEHAVDVVLSLEVEDGTRPHRLLRASKNRFGSTDGACGLVMKKSGLAFLQGGRQGRNEAR
jgi:DNA repair protein RadA/Sms